MCVFMRCICYFSVYQVNLFKDNGEVICFNNPKVQACLQSNTFVVTGHAETKRKRPTYSISKSSPFHRTTVQHVLIRAAEISD